VEAVEEDRLESGKGFVEGEGKVDEKMHFVDCNHL
jgi:hypothetical protein